MDYSYQPIAAKKVLENALNNKYIASVLAACPSSGKTTISHIIINEYLKLYPNANVVVLTEGQNVLKNQYLEELDTPNVKINFTYGDFGSNAQVQVGIPQSIHNLQIANIDLLIVDECHNYYLENTDQRIIEYFRVKHQVIMTGSPTKFNKHNKNNISKYGMYYISADFLREKGIFSGVDLDVATVKQIRNPIETIKDIFEQAKNTMYDTGRPSHVDLSKIMIVCPTIDYAQILYRYLTKRHHKVSLSTSENDNDNQQLRDFKANKTNILLVVNKGILGFNDKSLTAIFDLKSSDNLDTSYQLFARVLRTHPKGIRKSYWRVANSRKDYVKQTCVLHKMIALMNDKVFKGFTGNNIYLERY